MRKVTLSDLLLLLRGLSGSSRSSPPPAFYAALKRRERLSARDVRAIAVHEAGHAMLYAALRPLPDYVNVNLYDRPGRDDVLGDVTKIIYPHQLEDLTFMRWHMMMLLAGQAAERILLNEETVGPAQDLEQWTALAQDLLKLCCDDIFYTRPADPFQHGSNERLLMRALNQQRTTVQDFLRINLSVLQDLAAALEQRRHLTAGELRMFVAGVHLPSGFPTPDLS